MMKTILTIVVMAVIATVVGLIVMYGGFYNISAMDEHTAITLWMIETTKDNSIESGAGDVSVPEDLDDSTMISQGFEHFDHSCIECHGAPGIQSEEFALGLYPQAPGLSDEIEEWTPAELFWITKHGIKMTGMPAFGDTHRDEDIWAIVAFLRALPDLGYYGYLDMRKAHGEGSESSEGEEGHSHEGHEH